MPTRMRDADHLTAEVPYLRSDLDSIHVEFTARILGPEVFEPHQVKIRNGRTANIPPSLEREGFQLVQDRCPIVEDRLDDLMADEGLVDGSQAKRVYWEETIPLIRELSGAREVFPLFASTIRYSPVLKKKAMTPAGWPHLDYDSEEAETQLLEALEMNGLTPEPYSRFVLYQGWRVLSPPPQDYPLVMCDGRTVFPTDIIPLDYHMRTETRDITYKSSAARYNPSHAWWYYPDMTSEEMLVFIGYDSARGDSFKTLHVSFEDHTQITPVPRVSIESRYFALFD